MPVLRMLVLLSFSYFIEAISSFCPARAKARVLGDSDVEKGAFAVCSDLSVAETYKGKGEYVRGDDSWWYYYEEKRS
jgi:hypothetical protein